MMMMMMNNDDDVINDSSCHCGATTEDAHHYFIQCPMYEIERQILRQNIEMVSSFTVKVILFGDPQLSLKQNKVIFGAVHEFMETTRRFS